jgi:hypothetical protein
MAMKNRRNGFIAETVSSMLSLFVWGKDNNYSRRKQKALSKLVFYY